ncbi:RNA polymerase sigma factor [Stieleria maiorica]|uniref:RNA polymerase sigma factor n=1 Tax=Stieleria maiorica TaxID=2795974 RepID=A0A5B9M8G6_9BACT|nr:sigma factor [Stieleria maiorica]QEF97461.1 RNA polymerase sigma factor [Stieleria maiorica]
MYVSSRSRLASIATSWTLIQRAHAGEDTRASNARFGIIDQYGGAAWKYLLGVARDETLAEDLFQEFVLRILRGDLCRVTPQKGRFRDYIKSVLINLVRDHYRQHERLAVSLGEERTAAAPTCDEPADAFDSSWREALLRDTWQELKRCHPALFAVLHLHVDRVDEPASAKARRLGETLGQTFTANRFRVTLHRAREKFSAILQDKVAATLEDPSEACLRHELKHLRLLRYCRRADSPAP